MTYVKAKGFKIFRDRKPPFKQRCYHRASGTPIDLDKHPVGSAGWFSECQRIDAVGQMIEQAKPGTLGQLIKKYQASDEFAELAPRTQADYRKRLDYLKPLEHVALTKFTPPFVVKIRDKARADHKWHFANYVVIVLSALFDWGRARGAIATNPAFRLKRLRRPKHLPDANRPWTDDERDAVEQALPPHMRLPVALMMYCARSAGRARSTTNSHQGWSARYRARQDWRARVRPPPRARGRSPVRRARTLGNDDMREQLRQAVDRIGL